MKAKLSIIRVQIREFIGNVLLSKTIDRLYMYIREHGTNEQFKIAYDSYELYCNGEISIWQLHRELKSITRNIR